MVIVELDDDDDDENNEENREIRQIYEQHMLVQILLKYLQKQMLVFLSFGLFFQLHL